MKKLHTKLENLQDSLNELIARKPGVVLADTIDPVQAEIRYKSLVQGLQECRQIVLNIEVTSACNLRCQFCAMHRDPIDKHSSKPTVRKQKVVRSMRLTAFSNIIKRLEGLPPLKVLYLVGHGEPLLNPHLPEMVGLARDNSIAKRIVIVTNGVLLNSNVLRSLVSRGVNEIRVSLDLFSPKKYEEVKGKDHALTVRNNVESCLQTIRSENLPVSFNIECLNWRTSDPDLQLETHKIIDYFSGLVSEVSGASIRIRNEFGWVNQMEQKETDCSGGRHLPCEQPFFQLLVHADGDISPCCLDSSKTFVVGNIFAVKSLREIMFNFPLKRFREKLLMQDYKGIEPCRVCNFSSPVDLLLLERRQEVLKIMEIERNKKVV